ncbi:MAG: ThiF family adenylyltransferase [Anaerolineales bacterium]|nr:ThiF family adenylyltransferase [Anaerolineales bacterium]
MKKKGVAHARTALLEAASAVPVRLAHPEGLHLVLVGCGGTGSWLAPAVVRLARAWSEDLGWSVAVTFVDPDVVEARNTFRQNFCAAEVGLPKAEALAIRYSAAWGVPITVRPTPFKSDVLRGPSYHTTHILLGCVDNGAARQSLHDALDGLSYYGTSRVWWIDSGNTRAGGQVLVGSALARRDLRHAFTIPGLCTALPSPGWQRPELLETTPEEAAGDDLDCAVLAIQNSQSLTVNQIMAAHMADVLNRLVSGELRSYAHHVNLNAGVVSSRFITPESIARLTRSRVASISRPIPVR